MCCKIPLSACFEYSRNISLSCCTLGSVPVVFFLHCFFYNILFHIFSYAMRGGESASPRFVVFWASWRSLSTCYPLSGRASIGWRVYMQTYARKYVLVLVYVCVSVLGFLHSFFRSCFAILKYICLPGGISVLSHSLHQIRKTQRHKKIEIMQGTKWKRERESSR